MNDNNFSERYIRELDELSNQENLDMNLLKVFCEYVSSNSSFKYNGTYLLDSIKIFEEKLEIYKEKRKLITKFKDNLNYQYDGLNGWYMIFDNLYIISPAFEMDLLLNIKTPDYLKQFVNQFNFFDLDLDSISIRYIKIDDTNGGAIEAEYVEKQKIKKNKIGEEIELFSMVEETLTIKFLEGEGDR